MTALSRRDYSASEKLLDVLKDSPYPNCTLYLIWHYVSGGHMELARQEYRWDSDKLGRHRAIVEQVLFSDEKEP